jgi:choline-glycine betaine transporter
VSPIRTSILWWGVAFVAAPVVLLSFMFLAVMQPIAIVAAPLYFGFLMFPIVGLAEKLTAKPRCPKCRKIFVDAHAGREPGVRRTLGSSAARAT